MIQPGQYYRRTLRSRKYEDDDIQRLPLDALVLITEIEGDKITAISADAANMSNHCTPMFQFTSEELADEWELAPDGAEIRSRQYQEVLQQVLAVREDMKQAALSAPSSQNLLPSADTVSSVSSTHDLVQLSKTAATTVRQNIKHVRVAIMKAQERAIEVSRRVEALTAEQKEYLQVQLKQMSTMVKIAEETIWTLNVYLGYNEVVERLRKGVPASIDEKIVIRQLVLYMDEECAINADEGGIDYKSMKLFDTWILKSSKNLQQVLPEPKGIIALKVRRTEKKYSEDPRTNAEENEENFKTYWLIRNGENLYRICTHLEVNDVIVSREKEFQDLFISREYNSHTQEHEERPMRPGTQEYSNAMDTASAMNRHYLRILLFLQGILDRTPIFKPMPLERINLFDELQHGEFIHYVYDGENSRLLGDGREAFRQLQRRVNSTLTPGCRVIVAEKALSYQTVQERVSKRSWYRTRLPKGVGLYTVERRNNEYCIMLESEDENDARRASLPLSEADEFFINYDAITVEEAEYYLHDRINRSEYKTMFPVLRYVIREKTKEQKDEAPFLNLLQAKMQEMSGEEVPLEVVQEFASWWKFKNFTHRALTSDDTKAYEMILSRFSQSLKAQEYREKYMDTFLSVGRALVKEAGEERDRIVYIGHKTLNSIVLFRAMSPVRWLPHAVNRIFVAEETYTVTVRSKVPSYTLVRTTPDTQIIASRLTQWKTLYEGRYFPLWNTSVRYTGDLLTDADIATAVELAKEKREERSRWRSTEEKQRSADRLLCITHDRKNVYAYYQEYATIVEGQYALSGVIREPEVEKLRFCKSSSNKSQIVYQGNADDGYMYRLVRHYRSFFSREEDEKEITTVEEWLQRLQNAFSEHILFTNLKHIQRLVDDIRLADELKKIEAGMQHQVDGYMRPIEEAIQKRHKENVRRQFMEENNHDEELWEFEQTVYQKKKEPSVTIDNLWACCTYFVERGESVEGKTVEEVLTAAQALPIKTRRRGNIDGKALAKEIELYRKDFPNILSLRISPYVPKPEEDEE